MLVHSRATHAPQPKLCWSEPSPSFKPPKPLWAQTCSLSLSLLLTHCCTPLHSTPRRAIDIDMTSRKDSGPSPSSNKTSNSWPTSDSNDNDNDNDNDNGCTNLPTNQPTNQHIYERRTTECSPPLRTTNRRTIDEVYEQTTNERTNALSPPSKIENRNSKIENRNSEIANVIVPKVPTLYSRHHVV